MAPIHLKSRYAKDLQQHPFNLKRVLLALPNHRLSWNHRPQMEQMYPNHKVLPVTYTSLTLHKAPARS